MQSSELQAMLTHDERHWWYRGRRRVLRAMLDDCAPPAPCRILDAGCGSGRTLDDLAEYGYVSGVDISREAVEAARCRGHADVRVGSLERLPFASASFDLITCLDVIEHTPDDRHTLRELRRVARPGGLLVVTVPAYQSLWSKHDVANGHYRRYRAPTLRRAAADAGWQALRHTYFNTLLLPPAALVRLAERGRSARAGHSDLALTPPWLNGLLEWPLRAEAWAVRSSLRLPAGLSLLAVLRKPAPVISVARMQPTRGLAVPRVAA